MTVRLSPIGNDAPFVDASGIPLNGGQLFTYLAGSVSTAQTAYTDSAGTVPHANPIILDSNGYPSSGGSVQEIWLTSGVSYKFVLKNAVNVTVWSRDNISGINDTTLTLDQWAAGPTPTYVSATSFTLSGDQTSTFHVGRRLKSTNSGGTIYSTIVAVTVVIGPITTGVTVANDSGTLDSGLSAVFYSVTSALNPSIDADMVNRKGTAVVSAATTDIWKIAGDYVHITGSTGPITSFGTAPYAGAQRTVIFDSTPTITYNATTLVLPGSADIVAAANDRMIMRADTTANMVVVDYLRATGQSIGGGAAPIASGRNIAARTNASTPNTKLDITADEVVLENASGNLFKASSVNGTINFGTVGANGIDAGTQAASTWYYGWVIAKVDGTVAVLGSLSSTAPTLPSGYTYKALITAARSDGSTHFIPYRQFGNRVGLEGALNLLNPNLTATPTSETAKDISANIPSIASHFTISVYCANGASTGGGAVNSYIAIRVVTTVELYKIPFGAAASSPLNFFGLASRLPNLGQNFYYLLSATTNISSGALVVDLLSFELPGGGQ